MAKAERARRCIVTGDCSGESALVRFALGPDGAVYPDPAAKAPGRGAWVRAEHAHVQTAVKRNLFARAFKAKAAAPPDLVERTESALAARCLAILGMGRKAGALALGYEQVEAAIKDKPPLEIVEACDGAPEGRERLLKLAFARWGAPARVCGCFGAEEISMALGRIV